MSGTSHQAAAWIYRGIWKVLVDLFRVPPEAPTLPSAGSERPQSFQPAEGYLRYLKFIFWVLLGLFDVALTGVYVLVAIGLWMADLWWVALLLLPPALVLIVAPDIVYYIGIHLRYDTTWYVVSDRSLRLRHGVWIIRETTITFENVQNVTVHQGPLQRCFGIADLVVDTAGGGGGGKGEHAAANTHRGVLAGIADAPQWRDLIVARVRGSRSAGLGDESHSDTRLIPSAAAWTADHLAALREIRQEITLLAR